MESPLSSSSPWTTLDEVDSTQSVAADAIRAGQKVGVLFSHHQSQGRGRFGRTWVSSRGDSLTYSLVFDAYADHAKPYLIGMSVAVAAAGVLHCQLQWPNDLVCGKRKLGGILTEIILDPHGRRIPVVGVGINLNQAAMPEELEAIATSMAIARGGHYDPESIGRRILNRLADLPEPDAWEPLAPIWGLFDATPGKRFRLPTGEEAIALGVGSDGQLMCSVEGESRSVAAADALLG